MNEKIKLLDSKISDQFDLYIDRSEISEIVESLGRKISEEYKGQNLTLIAVLRGSFVFLADLVRHIQGVQVKIDFVRLKAFGRTEENVGTITLDKDITCDVNGSNVLIIEEIIDSGRALNFLTKRLQEANPKTLRVMTLFDKPHRRPVQTEIDFIGKTIENEFVVGYGLDLENYGRNIQDLYCLRYPN